MPSNLTFDSTKSFRDKILAKNLSVPNGPQTFTSSNYAERELNIRPVLDPGTIDEWNQNGIGLPNSVDNILKKTQTVNTFKPLSYTVFTDLSTLTRRANLKLYPYFHTGQEHSLIGVLNTDNFKHESELFKFAATTIKDDKYGFQSTRTTQNTFFDNGNILNNNIGSINTILGKDRINNGNYKITVDNNQKTFDGIVDGTETSWTEIPGNYLSNPINPILNNTVNDITNSLIKNSPAMSSIFGMGQSYNVSKRPSDIFVQYLGEKQRQFLFNSLSYLRYSPNYSDVTMDNQTPLQLANSLLGSSYIGDDLFNDVKSSLTDLYGRPIKGNFYLTLLFDETEAMLFHRTRNIGQGGGIAGNLTWISKSSKNKLGANNNEFNSERTLYDNTLSSNFTFRNGSILDTTQSILNSMPNTGKNSRSHVANVIDQTSRVFADGDTMISRGSAIKYVNSFTKDEGGVEYCRVWTKDRSYMNYSDTMKRTGLLRKYNSSVLSTPWNLNIYPNSNGNGSFDGSSTNMAPGKGDGFYSKKYMFSLENLAWKTSNTPGFTYNDLPYCERGPNDGRVMWFPPYDLKISEQSSANWEENVFLGRPEPVYTYQNAKRSGQISFKVIVDHPSVLNLLVGKHFKGMSDEEADNYINAFFAGCEEIDFYSLIRKYSTLNQSDVELVKAYLNGDSTNKSIKKIVSTSSIKDNQVPVSPPTPGGNLNQTFNLYFDNDLPNVGKNELYSSNNYEEVYVPYSKNSGYWDFYDGLKALTGTTDIGSYAPGWSENRKEDYKLLTGINTKTRPNNNDINTFITNQLDKYNSFTNEFTGQYAGYTGHTQLIKDNLTNKRIKKIEVNIESKSSAVSTTDYNFRLAYRRSHSILTDLIKKIAKDDGSTAINKIVWKNDPLPKSSTPPKEPPITLNLKDLGYDEDGEFIINHILNVGETGSVKDPSSTKNINCGDENLYNAVEFKRHGSIANWCRESELKFIVDLKDPDQPATTVPDSVSKVNIQSINDTKTTKPSIDVLKKIIMKVLSECYYFKQLEEDSPLQFSSLREKLRYFHPAFHSMTPEGLNSRLTFLQQCVRPGDTIPVKGLSDENDLNARNSTFGPPPICVLRIGDFFHSKVIIRDVNITYDENVWDLNPEGIGVQPMIANVTLQVNFIGGHGMQNPVEKLQNALTSNFYANTEVYDQRSTVTEDRTKFNKEQLENLMKDYVNPLNSNYNGLNNSLDKLSEGNYIGNMNSSNINYTTIIKDLNTKTINYFNSYIDANEKIVNKYGKTFASLLLSPTYRTINTFDVNIDTSVITTINLFGNYPKGYELNVLISNFKPVIVNKILDPSVNLTRLLKLNISDSLNKMSEEILKQYISKKVEDYLNNSTFGEVKNLENSRNELITILDKLNFLVSVGRDCKSSGDVYDGIVLSGFTGNEFYSKYSQNVDFLINTTDLFTSNIDDTFKFTNGSLTDDDLFKFLTVFLSKNDVKPLLDLYKNRNSLFFTTKVLEDINKGLNSFITITVIPKLNIGTMKLPVNTETNVNYVIQDNYNLTDSDKVQLIKVNTTSGVNTDSKLNYFRK